MPHVSAPQTIGPSGLAYPAALYATNLAPRAERVKMATIGHNSGEVTDKAKLEKHYKSMLPVIQQQRALSEQLADLRQSAKAEGVNAGDVIKLIRKQLRTVEQQEREQSSRECCAEYADLLQLSLEF